MTKQFLSYVRMQITLCFISVFFLIEPAYAYLDPGTGSLIIQMLIVCSLRIVILPTGCWRASMQQDVAKKLAMDLLLVVI